jgi:hypothetical protein
VIAVPILFLVVVNNLPARQFSSIESPDKTYMVNLRGRKSSPRRMFVMHSVYFDLYRRVELFLLFDLDRQARATLSFQPKRDEGWITVEGEFEDGTRVVAARVSYYVVPNSKGPFKEQIAIQDDASKVRPHSH